MTTTRHLVDPDLASAIEQLPVFDFSPATLPQIRAEQKEIAARQAAELPPTADIDVSEHLVPGPDGAPDVRVLLYLPRNAVSRLSALLWIHGGGYVIGSADSDDARVKGIVQHVGCAAASVDYRLAPETPFPGNVEDCYAALRWLYEHSGELGIDSRYLAVGGASAGGGLAAALSLLARDRHKVPIAFQLLIYPMLDDRTASTTNPHPYAGEFNWTPEANHFGWSALLGHEPGKEGVSPYAAAARAENLVGLPPAYISVGTLDLFVEEDLEYARRLTRAGVQTELHLYPGAYHGFQVNPDAWISRAEERNSEQALRRALRPR
jgi:acetyl esterase/lipase